MKYITALRSLCESFTMRGFTLIETLVAISLVSVAIVAPMSLVSRSLSSAFYARDQVAAYHLAQEGIEAVRAIRDSNILRLTLSSGAQCPSGGPMTLYCGIPLNTNFRVDARQQNADDVASACTGNQCVLETDSFLYGYGIGEDTKFTRVLRAEPVGAGIDEIQISSTVTWKNVGRADSTFTIYENLYRWIDDGAAAEGD